MNYSGYCKTCNSKIDSSLEFCFEHTTICTAVPGLVDMFKPAVLVAPGNVLPSPLDEARECFRACPNCAPVGCCSGQDCGCQGQPVGFNVTDKCGDDCYVKLWSECKRLRQDKLLLDRLEKSGRRQAIVVTCDPGDPEGGVPPAWEVDKFVGTQSAPAYKTIAMGVTLRLALTAALPNI